MAHGTGFVSELRNGIYAMSEFTEGLVESSSNFGIIDFDAEAGNAFSATVYFRSSDADRMAEMKGAHTELAENCGMEIAFDGATPSWAVNPSSALSELVKSAYREAAGEDIHVLQVHAGLETGIFAALCPELDMASIGFDVTGPHSIKETCRIDTIPLVYSAPKKIIAAIE